MEFKVDLFLEVRGFPEMVGSLWRPGQIQGQLGGPGQDDGKSGPGEDPRATPEMGEVAEPDFDTAPRMEDDFLDGEKLRVQGRLAADGLGQGLLGGPQQDP
jgi:hypothetical protein